MEGDITMVDITETDIITTEDTGTEVGTTITGDIAIIMEDDTEHSRDIMDIIEMPKNIDSIEVGHIAKTTTEAIIKLPAIIEITDKPIKRTGQHESLEFQIHHGHVIIADIKSIANENK